MDSERRSWGLPAAGQAHLTGELRAYGPEALSVPSQAYPAAESHQ